jgi:hypothetical protein
VSEEELGGRVCELSPDWYVKFVLGRYIYYSRSCVGIGATTKEVTGADGRKEWVNPLVRAKGKLAYSKGRMGRAYGDKEWEAFGATLRADDGM